MSLLEEIKNKLKSEKNLSDSSIKLYLSNLSKLNDDKPIKNLNFLVDSEKIIVKLDKYKENTKRNYLIAITSILSLFRDKNKKMNKLYNEYLQRMIGKNKELKQVESQNIMSDTQKINWINWDDVIDIRNKFQNKVNEFKNDKIISESQYNILLQYIILCLYTMMPPRRNVDYQFMNVVKSKAQALDDSINYFIFDDKQFIFNKYKTAKVIGKIIVDVAPDLIESIDVFLKHHPVIKGKINTKTNTRLLVYYNGNGFNGSNSITRILNLIFNKNVASSMLRHIYLTHTSGDALKTIKDNAQKMGHSSNMAIQYIKQN